MNTKRFRVLRWMALGTTFMIVLAMCASWSSADDPASVEDDVPAPIEEVAWVIQDQAPLYCGKRLMGRLELGSMVQVKQERGAWTYVHHSPGRTLKASGWVLSRQLVTSNGAIGVLRTMIEQTPSDSRLYVARAMAYFHLYRDLQAALDDADTAIRLAPHSVMAHRLRGGVLWAYERHAEVIESIDRAIEAGGPRAELLYWRGRCWSDIHEYGKAIEDFSASYAIDRNEDTLRGRASAYLDLKDYDRAIADARLLLRSNPWVREIIVRALLAKGDAHGALEEARLLIRCSGNRYESLFLLGKAAIAAEQYAEAKEAFSRMGKEGSGLLTNEKIEMEMEVSRFLASAPDAAARDPKGAIHRARLAFVFRLRDSRGVDWELVSARGFWDYPLEGIGAGWEDWRVLETMALAYASDAAYRDAVAWQLKAVEVAPEAERPRLQKQLEDYRTKSSDKKGGSL